MKNLFIFSILLVLHVYVHSAPPIITSSPVSEVDQDALYSYDFKASDSDNEPLLWSVKTGYTLPSWLSLSINFGSVTTIAGSGFASSSDNVDPLLATFNNPWGMVVTSSRDIFISESNGYAIRKLDAITGSVSTVAGAQVAGSNDHVDSLLATFNRRSFLAIDRDENIFVADNHNNVIRRVDFTTGGVTTVAGSGSAGSLDNANPLLATFSRPHGIALDSDNNIYVISERRVRRIDAITKAVTTIAGSAATGLSDNTAPLLATFSFLRGIAIDSNDDIFLADMYKIRKIDSVTGAVSTIAGSGASGSTDNIDPMLATFNSPYSLAIDSRDNVFVSGTLNHNIRKIDYLTGEVTTVAGSKTVESGFNDDSDSLLARFYNPLGISIDSNDNIYISDYSNHRIRKVSSGQKLTGKPTNSDIGDHNICLIVNDGTTDVDHCFAITVNNINDAPVMTGSPSITANEDSAYSFMPAVTDVDTVDSHNFSITNKPSWATFVASTGLLTGTPINSDVDVYPNIIITVTDAAGATDTLTSFTITVNNTNDAPLISGSPATSVNEDANYSFIPSVTDIDLGDTYSYSISNQPQWATFDSITGTLSGIPTNSDAGMHPNIVITVTDAAGATASLASFAITVNTTNDVPTINASAQVLFINDKEEIMPFANVLLFDDSDTISLSLNFDAGNGILNGNGFSGSSGAYSIASQSVDSVQTILQSLRFIPRQNQVSAGNFVNTLFYLTATDGVLTSAVNSSIQVSTESVNDAPIVYGQSIRVVEGSIADIAFYAEDLENDEITFSQMSSPAHGELAISGDIGTYISDQGYTGGDRFSIVANDGFDDSLPFVVDLKVLAEGDETMAVNDTIYLPVNSVTHQYELDVLANDNQANDPKLVSVLCLFGEVRIENNMLILYLETIAQPFITLTYVIEDSRGIYAKAQVNLVLDG